MDSTPRRADADDTSVARRAIRAATAAPQSTRPSATTRPADIHCSAPEASSGESPRKNRTVPVSPAGQTRTTTPETVRTRLTIPSPSEETRQVCTTMSSSAMPANANRRPMPFTPLCCVAARYTSAPPTKSAQSASGVITTAMITAKMRRMGDVRRTGLSMVMDDSSAPVLPRLLREASSGLSGTRRGFDTRPPSSGATQPTHTRPPSSGATQPANARRWFRYGRCAPYSTRECAPYSTREEADGLCGELRRTSERIERDDDAGLVHREGLQRGELRVE